MTYDLKIWFRSEWKKYIPIVLIFAYVAITVSISADSIGTSPNIIDFLFGLFKGEIPYVVNTYESMRIPFTVPPLYVLFNFYLSWIIGYYPLKDMNNLGKMVMLKHRTKKKWWLNKCIWNVCTILSCYFVGYLTFIVALVVKGDFSFHCNRSLLKEIINNDKVDYTRIASLSRSSLIIICIVIPVIISIGLSMMQMFLSLIIKPVYSQVIILSILIMSVFSCKVFLPGNYLMIIRNKLILTDSGVPSNIGLLIGILMMIIGGSAGFIVIKKRDIF